MGNWEIFYKFVYVCVFITIWHDNAHSKNHRLSNKIPNARHGKPPFELLVRGIYEDSQII